MILAYDELVDFIAGGSTPQSVIDFRPSEATKAHVADLIRRQKSDSLYADETAEMNHYLQIEHLMRLAKARARQHAGADALRIIFAETTVTTQHLADGIAADYGKAECLAGLEIMPGTYGSSCQSTTHPDSLKYLVRASIFGTQSSYPSDPRFRRIR